MKRIVLLVGLLLAGGASTALADQFAPPSGPVGPGPGPGMQGPGMQGQGMQGPGTQRQRHRHRLPPQVRQQLLQRFDRDGDGRLTGRERRAAKRFVLRLRHQLRQDRQHGRQQPQGFKGRGRAQTRTGM